MKINKKKLLTAAMAVIMVATTMIISASASDNYTGNTYQKNLNYDYTSEHAVVDGMNIFMKYNVGHTNSTVAFAQTSIQLGLGPATGKSYVAFMQRSLLGFDAGFKQQSSTYKKSNGYIDANVYGDTNVLYANYVLHSGTSNVTVDWRFDRKYQHNG